MRFINKISAAAVAGIAAAGIAATMATAGPIEDRQQAMKDVGGAMKVLAGMAKKEMAFDANMARLAAIAMAARLEDAKGMFPAGSDKGDTETWTKAEAFSDKAGFDKIMADAAAAAHGAANVKAEGDLLPALKKLGATCGSCHKAYRRPK